MNAAPQGVIPFSCSTNLSNDVLDAIRLRAKLGSKAMEVCLYLHRHTFGYAGIHRKQGRPETACRFALAHWSREVPCDKSNLKRILSELDACHIIEFAPDPTEPGSGWIQWNTDFNSWLPYDRRRAARAQPPALPAEITTADSSEITTAAPSIGCKITTADSSEITTVGSHQPRKAAAPSADLNKEIRKKETEEGAPARKPVTYVSLMDPDHQRVIETLRADPRWRPKDPLEKVIIEELAKTFWDPSFLLQQARAYTDKATGNISITGFEEWCKSPVGEDKWNRFSEMRRRRISEARAYEHQRQAGKKGSDAALREAERKRQGEAIWQHARELEAERQRMLDASAQRARERNALPNPTIAAARMHLTPNPAPTSSHAN